MTVAGTNVNKVPPDGGYGWVVVCAHALNLMVVLPLLFGFGLVFKEAMSDVGLSHSQGSFIIILNNSTGMVMTLLAGPLLKRFGYRKVAVTGSILASLGLFITAISSSFWMFILAYGIINSTGGGTVLTSSSIALNSYFREKRGRAIGIAMSCMGLGTMGMPLIIGGLLTSFGWRYAVLTLSAISLHSLVSACLLRPVKWYLRYPPHSEEIVPLNKNTDVELVNDKDVSSTKENGLQSEHNANSTAKCAASMQEKMTMSNPDVGKKYHKDLTSEDRCSWWESQEINLGSSINIFSDDHARKLTDVNDKVSAKKEQGTNILSKFVDLFDLTLLKDPIFVNILLGLAMATSSENNFFLFMPIIFQDMMQFETREIARLMSITGVTDTVFRLLTPFIGEWCKQPPRVMYLVGLVILITINTTMLFTSSFMGMVFLAILIGASRGFRAVNGNTLVPTYVPIERLPCAWGLQMFINGIIGIIIGSIVGRVREMSGAYDIPLVILNCITMFTLISWCAEFLYFKIKNKKI